MQQFDRHIRFLWSIAELLRDDLKRGKYQDVILPSRAAPRTLLVPGSRLAS